VRSQKARTRSEHRKAGQDVVAQIIGKSLEEHLR